MRAMCMTDRVSGGRREQARAERRQGIRVSSTRDVVLPSPPEEEQQVAGLAGDPGIRVIGVDTAYHGE